MVEAPEPKAAEVVAPAPEQVAAEPKAAPKPEPAEPKPAAAPEKAEAKEAKAPEAAATALEEVKLAAKEKKVAQKSEDW